MEYKQKAEKKRITSTKKDTKNLPSKLKYFDAMTIEKKYLYIK